MRKASEVDPMWTISSPGGAIRWTWGTTSCWRMRRVPGAPAGYGRCGGLERRRIRRRGLGDGDVSVCVGVGGSRASFGFPGPSRRRDLVARGRTRARSGGAVVAHGVRGMSLLSSGPGRHHRIVTTRDRDPRPVSRIRGSRTRHPAGPCSDAFRARNRRPGRRVEARGPSAGGTRRRAVAPRLQHRIE